MESRRLSRCNIVLKRKYMSACLAIVNCGKPCGKPCGKLQSLWEHRRVGFAYLNASNEIDTGLLIQHVVINEENKIPQANQT